MYRTLAGLVVAFAVALALVGLTFSSSAEGRADYVFVNGTEPKTLDPQKMTGQPEGRIADAIFEGLTFRDNETLRPVPGSAVSWETSPDGLRWEFKLRPEAVWSNGERVTAHDFVFAWKRLLAPETASEYAYLLHFVRHAEAFNTFGSQAAALGGPDGVVAKLRALVGAAPSGLPVARWQAFVKEVGLTDLLTGVADPVLLPALTRATGTFSAAEASALADALEGERARRAAEHAAAVAHLGVDEGVFAPDPSTFVVELRTYTPYFLELTAFYPTFPVHRATVEARPDDWFQPGRIVTNGPFLLHRWTVNERIRLHKNPRYWGASSVSLETVDALPIENSTVAMNLYLTGSVDWSPAGYPQDLIDVVKRRPDFYGEPGMMVYYYRINCTRKPFDDPRVRIALGLAIDRQVLVEQVMRGGQVPAVTMVAPGIPAYRSPQGTLGFDVPRARALLKEAGFPDGKGFPKVALLHNTSEAHKKVAEWIADQLRRNLGVDARAVNQEWQSYQESVRRLDYDLARAGWIGDYRDPNTFLDMWITGGGNNQTGWGDAGYDRLIRLATKPLAVVEMPAAERDAFLATLKERPEAERLLAAVAAAADPKARLAAVDALRLHLFREAEAILIQDGLPVIPLYFYVVTGLVHPRVEGFHSRVRDVDGSMIPNLQDLHPFRDVRMRGPAGAPK